VHLIRRAQVPAQPLPGRVIQSVLGKDAHVPSAKMTIGFARYSAESGPMEPHQHAEETLYVVAARDGWVRCGDDPARLGAEVALEAGMVLHFPELEWHQFGFRGDGFVDALFCYGQVDHIRPEEIRISSAS
jgi:Cupin domain